MNFLTEYFQILIAMIIKSFAVLLLLALVNLDGFGQIQNPSPPPPVAQPDHLEPVESIFSLYDYQFEYYSRVRKILFEKLSDRSEVSLLIMPSFSPEKVFDIEYDREQANYFLVYHVGGKMIWNNKDWEKTIVYEYKKEIDKESVDLIRALFKAAISGTRFAKSGISGLDGEYYYFSYFEQGLRSGTTWSPVPGSKLDRLVRIGFELIGLAKNDDDTAIVDYKLKTKIKDLINEFNNAQR